MNKIRKDAREKKLCQNCGREFLGQKDKKFCKINCAIKYGAQKEKKNCLKCGAEFTASGKKKFCKDQCRVNYAFMNWYRRERDKSERSEPKKCLNCGNEFLKTGKRKFCKSQCAVNHGRRAWHRRQSKKIEQMNCADCNQVFSPEHPIIKRCLKCRQLKKEKNQIFLNCVVCGKQFLKDHALIKRCKTCRILDKRPVILEETQINKRRVKLNLSPVSKFLLLVRERGVLTKIHNVETLRMAAMLTGAKTMADVLGMVFGDGFNGELIKNNEDNRKYWGARLTSGFINEY